MHIKYFKPCDFPMRVILLLLLYCYCTYMLSNLHSAKNEQNKHMHSMQELMPDTYKELCDIRQTLEHNYHDMLDIEFTIQEGVLYMLQCRVGKRTGVAALTMAFDMLEEGLIDEKEVVMRVSPSQLDELLHPILDSTDEKKHKVIAKGLPAGPGGAVGVIALTSEKAHNCR